MPHHNARLLQPATRAELESLVATIESYPEAVGRVADKAWGQLLRLDRVPPHSAMIIKQELLAVGGDALMTPEAYLGASAEPTPLLAWASARGWAGLCRKLALFPVPALQQLGAEIAAALGSQSAARGELRVGGALWRWGARTLVMGIINATPDSFSQDGLLGDGLAEAAARQAGEFAAAGADMLDIGGESTRPGAKPVAAEEELRRVLPAIAAARAACDLPISIDTAKAEVAAQALAAGAAIINDIWGLRLPEGGWNADLARVAAESGAPIILMHNRRARNATTANVGHFAGVEYGDLAGEVAAELRECVAYAESQGIARERIIIDPGIGFGKTPDHNIALLRRLRELGSLGLPLLVGTSRKSFIGLATGAAPGERVFGTAATVSHAISQGADIVRVHDVAAMAQVCAMTDAIVRPGAWERLTAGSAT
ncbi:MAG TPA: dihydropteroate synthase [Herpetosiphonaceae bacterium]